MRKVSLLLLLGLGLSACWNKNFNEPGRVEFEKKSTEAVVVGGFPRTWAATQASLGKFPIVKKDIDMNSGRAYIITDWVRGKSDVLYHGFDVTRVPYVVRYKLYVYLVADGRSGRTRVTIKNTEEYLDDIITAGTDTQGSVQNWIRTESSTLKESKLLDQIDKLVRDPKFKAEP